MHALFYGLRIGPWPPAACGTLCLLSLAVLEASLLGLGVEICSLADEDMVSVGWLWGGRVISKSDCLAVRGRAGGLGTYQAPPAQALTGPS